MTRLAALLVLVCLVSHAGICPGQPVAGATRGPSAIRRGLRIRRNIGAGSTKATGRGAKRREQTGGSHLDLAEPARGGEEVASEPGEIGNPGNRVKIDEAVDEPEGVPEEEAPDEEASAAVEWRGPESEGLVPVGTEADGRSRRKGGETGIEAYIRAIVKEIDRAPEMVRIRYGAGAEDAPEETRDRRAPVPPSPDPLPAVGAGDALYARLLYDRELGLSGAGHAAAPAAAFARSRDAGASSGLIRDRLVVRARSMDFGGETVPVDAVALGLDCACYGLAGDVSYHWFERVILPAATGFVENFLIARSQPDRRIVQVDEGTVLSEERAYTRKQAVYSGAAAAAGQVGTILLEQAPSRQTVVIPRNTELAVMFVERLERRERRVPARVAAAVAADERTEPDSTGRREVPVVVRGRGEVR